MRIRLAILFLFFSPLIGAQDNNVITGIVVDEQSKEALVNALISINDIQFFDKTNEIGQFGIKDLPKGDFIITISLSDFVTKKIAVRMDTTAINLGTTYLRRDIAFEQTNNLITLTDSELLDDEAGSNPSGLLQATRDVFLSRAAFDFGQAFFRVRGYDAQNGTVLINGIPMNKLLNGRPQWNNWGGLNDVTKNQEFTNGLKVSDYVFGGILGNTNMDTKPSGLRPGTRISSSISNRTYAGRLMATYNSGLSKHGLAYAFSGSRRIAKQGYIDGTLYDAFSFFGALEYQFNSKNTLSFTGIYASNRRGRSSAITEEVFNLVGKNYNPYWGEQDGKIRNSRERKISEPVLMLNHYYTSDKLVLNTGFAYQFGSNARSRLGYYNAPNPDPTYYRYLPSFYVNSPIGANFISANSAKEGFLNEPQLNWDALYTANDNNKAAYILYDDIVYDKQYTMSTTGNMAVTNKLQFDFGLRYAMLNSENYARIHDLLGADFFIDMDPFSNTLNDVNGKVNKLDNEVINYNYRLEASQFESFSQVRFNANRWEVFVSGKYYITDYQREGIFKNERYLESSFGKSSGLKFTDFGVKGGLSYKITGRHIVTSHVAYLTKPPVLQNVFINPRENNDIVSNIQSEEISTVDLNYFMRFPSLTGRFSGFYTRFQNATDINFFFVDAGVGSDFVQEVITDLDKLHMGVEVGLEYQLSSAVKLTAVAAVGKYVYASNPNVSINFDTAGAEEDLINPNGNINLGIAAIKDYKLAQGPQKAFALGVEYRDPKYWWIGMTTNYLADNYANISTIIRTESFLLDPDTGQAFPNATKENVKKLLEQKTLDDFYLLNLVGGKSWLKKGKYISVFASVTNVFDAVFRTGGYEQSRNGNFGQLQQDNLSGTPSFAPKYWYGYGRTYFLNVAFSF